MLHRIREAMKFEPAAGLFGGAVQVDETWIGGDPKNWHASDPRNAGGRRGRSGVQTEKQPVVSLVHYETRSAHSRVVADVTAKSLLPAIQEVMDLKRTHLHTDGGAAYKTIAPMVAAHEWVDHKAGEYVRGNVSTNLERRLPLAAEAVPGRHPPPCFRGAPSALPAPVRLPLHALQGHRLGADAAGAEQRRRAAADLQATHRRSGLLVGHADGLAEDLGSGTSTRSPQVEWSPVVLSRRSLAL